LFLLANPILEIKLHRREAKAFFSQSCHREPPLGGVAIQADRTMCGGLRRKQSSQ
jgi:hypothetical protein